MLGKLQLGRRARVALRPVVSRLFFEDLVAATDSFTRVTWLGRPIWQNVLVLHEPRLRQVMTGGPAGED